MAKGLLQEVTHTYTNKEGELIEQTESKTWTFSRGSEPFFLTYVNCISWMYDLKSITTIKLLYKILEMSRFNENKVDITTSRRKAICSELAISDTMFSKSLTQLVSLGILSGSQGTFSINEEIFWKGDYRTRERLLNSRCSMTITPVIDNDTNN